MKAYYVTAVLGGYRHFLFIDTVKGTTTLKAIKPGLLSVTFFINENVAGEYIGELRHREAVHCTVKQIEVPDDSWIALQ